MVVVALPGHPHRLNSGDRTQIIFIAVQTWRCLGWGRGVWKAEKSTTAQLKPCQVPEEANLLI